MERHYITDYSNLVSEWSDENNITPDKVTTGSHKRIIWNGVCGHKWEAIVKNRIHGSGCPYCTGNKVTKGINDLATFYPDLSSEWSANNLTLKPTMVTCNSNKVVWWTGRCGHEWRARIADRTKGHGCPYCAGKILAGFNDIATTNPEVMEEWSDKNNVDPTCYSKKSTLSVWWNCKSCGNEWKAVIATKVNGTKCPFCRFELTKQHYQKMLEDRKRERYLRKNRCILYFKKYINDRQMLFIQNDDSELGVPLQFYSPDYRVAIEFINGYVSNIQRRVDFVKNDLCLKNRIHMVRVLGVGVRGFDNCLCISLKDDSDEALSEALEVVFGRFRVYDDI